MCGKPIWSSFRTLRHSDMIFRAYFRPPANGFSRFWRPAGKQLFPVIVVKEPIDVRHTDLADFYGGHAISFLFRPIMRNRRPVG